MENKIQKSVEARIRLTALNLVDYYRSGLMASANQCWDMLLGEVTIYIEVFDCEEKSDIDYALNAIKNACKIYDVNFSDVCYDIIAK